MKKRQKRSFRSKYLLILLLISAIVFISSTYAWFTTNRTVTVSTIDVHVQTVSGIQISVDGINWKSSITKDDLLGATSTYSANINTLPEELEPVSTGLTFDATNAGQLEMFYGKVEADETGVYKLTATKDAPKTDGTHFIVFDIFLKTTGEIPDGELYLTADSGAQCTGTNVGIQNATRIAFVKEGNAADGSAVSTIQGLATSSADDVYLWEPHYDAHTAAAVAHASATYGITTTTNPANNSLIPYSGVIKAFTTGINLADATQAKDSTTFKSVTPTYTTKASNAANVPIFGLQPGITKLRVYMWIEGQDVDCENNASGSDIDFNLKFTIDAN